MTDWTPADWFGAFTAAGVVLSGAGTFYAAIKIKHVEHATNSMKDALVAAALKSGLATGKKEGREEQKAEDKAAKDELP